MTNVLLALILLVLLFGAGTVLGFFSTIFWIIFGVLLVVGIVVGTTGAVKNDVHNAKTSYAKNPKRAQMIWFLIVIFFIYSFVFIDLMR